MKNRVQIEIMLTHNEYEILRVTDKQFGDWKYGLFKNKNWVEWSYDFNKLKNKVYAQ